MTKFGHKICKPTPTYEDCKFRLFCKQNGCCDFMDVFHIRKHFDFDLLYESSLLRYVEYKCGRYCFQLTSFDALNRLLRGRLFKKYIETITWKDKEIHIFVEKGKYF